MQKVKTSKIAAFINTTPDAETPIWSRVRKQSELKLKYDATTSEETYVDEDAPTTEVERYAVGFDGELVCHKGDPVFDYIDGLRQSRATGSDCETQCLVVYIYDEENSAYAAELNNCVVQVSDFGGEGGGGIAKLNYNTAFNGTHKRGTVTIKDGAPTFVETQTETAQASAE